MELKKKYMALLLNQTQQVNLKISWPGSLPSPVLKLTRIRVAPMWFNLLYGSKSNKNNR
jgi:hypothetical protein